MNGLGLGREADERQREGRRQALIFRVVILLVFGIIIAQLWRLQIVEGPQYRERADVNRIRVSSIPPPRGIVYDRTGRIVAANAPIFVVSIIPGDVPRDSEQEVIDRLAHLLQEPPEAVRRAYERGKERGDALTPVTVKQHASREAVMRVEEHHSYLPGVVVSVEASRTYPAGPLVAHLLGYTGSLSPDLLGEAEYQRYVENGYLPSDRLGVAGLESSYEQTLRGQLGRRMVEVDVTGRVVNELRQEPPSPGNNLVMTIDLDLQRSVHERLREGLHNSPVGAAVVMRPDTGEVLAFVSLPNFDNNLFTPVGARDDELEQLLHDERQPLFHRGVAGLYAPGSTFKLVTGAGALQEGMAQRDTIIESEGAIFVPHDRDPNYRERFPDWAPLGRMNFVEGIANSSNVYFFYLGGGYEPENFRGLGLERLARYARLFGFGTPSGIDLPGEAGGLVPDEEWKVRVQGQGWFRGDTYNMSIGQGYVQSNILHVANMSNVIASGGLLVKPRLAQAVTNPQGEVIQTFEPQVRWQVPVAPEHLALLAEGMEAGFHIGELLTDFHTPDLRVAGKTGTAEFHGELGPDGNLPTHGWFTGFVPADNPQISVTVFVERGTGSVDASPIAINIIRDYFGIVEEPE